PGPKPKPIISNLLNLPKDHPWLTYREWARTYGMHNDDSGISLHHVLHTHMMWVKSHELTYELFERRSAKYSDHTHHHAR
ncbi:hypothetical protein M422DRAFT_179389, partial [Sphaerobolus stellatus SS14]